MPNKNKDNIIDQLSMSIADDTGNQYEDDLDSISNSFNKTLTTALKSFNLSTFDDDGFIKKMRDLNLDNKKDKEMMRHVLNNLRSDYINVESLNQSELLLRRDITNICTQMPEMRDVINIIRDGIIECNVSTGQVSRSLIFENKEDDETLNAEVKDIENKHKLLMAIKNFIVPNTLRHGEMCIHVLPYAKLFAELESINQSKTSKSHNMSSPLGEAFKESIPNEVMKGFTESVSLYNDENLKSLMESASLVTKIDVADEYKIDLEGSPYIKSKSNESISKESVSEILKNISVYNGHSEIFAEMGPQGFKDFLLKEYKESKSRGSKKAKHFSEAMDWSTVTNSVFGNVDQDSIDFTSYKDIKGCYLKYLDGLRMVPIRMDRMVIGYYYVSTTMDTQINPANPNGIVDMSFQNYTRDKNLVDNLSNMIIRSFDKDMLEKNIKLKNEIAEIVMAHKFSEGKLSFIYIPENEVIRFVINEDENGRGHSVLEPTLFPARTYLMLTMYNLLFTLNNNTTRIHYLRSSGLNKNYASQVQRNMRKFQSRRITIDDIYSYSGVLNKVGGMGEMILPSGRNDYKALETDTIEAVQNPIDLEFLETQRRLAISGTGVPHLMMINAIDEADFAKTLEMANARYLSTVSSYKIDFNNYLTILYRRLLKYSTDMEDEEINSFRFQFNTIKQQELVITADMIQNFNSLVEVVESLYYSKSDLEDKDGNSTPKRMYLRRELAKEYLPQLDFDKLDEIIKNVDIYSKDDELQNRVNNIDINNKDLQEVEEQ